MVYFNVSIFNNEAVEEMFENFTIHLNDTARVSVIGTQYAVVDIREDETDGELFFCTPSLYSQHFYIRTFNVHEYVFT